MLTSMTGFGRAETALRPTGRAVVEIRSVNHKFLEVEARLPEGIQSHEDEVRELVTRRVQRGQVRVAVSAARGETRAPVVFQTARARWYLKELKGFRRQLGLKDEVTLPVLLNLPEVITASDRGTLSEKDWPRVEAAVSQAVGEMIRMRRQEGARLQKALQTEMRTLGLLAQEVRKRAPGIYRQAQERFADQIQALLKKNAADPTANRSAILAEAASIVRGQDVSEELARLDSHLKALRKSVQGQVDSFPPGNGQGKRSGSGSPGRTIDFLAQELQREVNTLGTKLRDAEVIRCVVAMKGQIEKLREQAANLE